MGADWKGFMASLKLYLFTQVCLINQSQSLKTYKLSFWQNSVDEGKHVPNPIQTNGLRLYVLFCLFFKWVVSNTIKVLMYRMGLWWMKTYPWKTALNQPCILLWDTPQLRRDERAHQGSPPGLFLGSHPPERGHNSCTLDQPKYNNPPSPKMERYCC